MRKIHNHRLCGFKFNLTIRTISIVLTIAFLSYDIIWAFPSRSFRETQNTKLAPQSFFSREDSIDRACASTLERLIENGAISRQALTIRAVKAILKKHRNEEWLVDNIAYTTTDHEVLISFSSGFILRYYDPTALSARDQERYSDQTDGAGEKIASLRLNRYLHKDLLKVKALPEDIARSVRPKAAKSEKPSIKLTQDEKIRPIIVPSEKFFMTAAHQVAERIAAYQGIIPGNVNIVVTKGDTMMGLLKSLAAEKGIDWARVRLLPLVECELLSSLSAFSFRSFVEEYLISGLPADNRVPPENIYDLSASNIYEYGQKLKAEFHPHIALIGIGRNGHIGYNEPGSPFNSVARKVELAEDTIKYDMAHNPIVMLQHQAGHKPEAFTIGLSEIASAESIFMLANTREKLESVKKAISGPVTTEVPGSFLQIPGVSKKVTVILNEDAASGIKDVTSGLTHNVDEDVKTISTMLDLAGFKIDAEGPTRRTLLELLATKYFDLIVDSDELRGVLKRFSENDKAIYGTSGIEKFERLFQNKILDFFLENSSQVLSASAWSASEDSHKIHETYKIFYRLAHVFKLPYVRHRIDDRKKLLTELILLNILPENGPAVGSAIRSKIVKNIVIDTIFLDRDPGISDFAIATVMELCADPGRMGKFFFGRLYPVLKDSENLPRFAMALIDLFVNVDRGFGAELQIRNKEALLAMTYKTIMDLINDDLNPQKDYFTNKLLEYTYAFIAIDRTQSTPAMLKLFEDMQAAVMAKHFDSIAQRDNTSSAATPRKVEDPFSRVIIHDFKNKLVVMGLGDLILLSGANITATDVKDDLEPVKEYVHISGLMLNAALNYLGGKASIDESSGVFNRCIVRLTEAINGIRNRIDQGGYNWDTSVRRNAQMLVEQGNLSVLPSLKGVAGWIDRGMNSTDVEALINEVVLSERARKMISDKTVIDIDISDDLKKASGLFTYKLILRMAVEELLSNAIKYSNAAKFKIAASLTGDGEVKVDVIDYGVGISRENLGKIFRPGGDGFTTAKDKDVGTGYGLSALDATIGSVGGKMSIDSQVDHGTVSSFTLPVNASLDIVSRPALSAPITVAVSGQKGAGRRIISQWLAAKLGLRYINVGFLARVIIYEMLKKGKAGKPIDFKNESEIVAFMEELFNSGRLNYITPSLYIDDVDTTEPGKADGVALREKIKAEIDDNDENTRTMYKIFNYQRVKTAMDEFLKSVSAGIMATGKYNGIVMRVSDPIPDPSIINIILVADIDARSLRSNTTAQKLDSLDEFTGRSGVNKEFPLVGKVDTTVINRITAEKALRSVVMQLPDQAAKEIVLAKLEARSELDAEKAHRDLLIQKMPEAKGKASLPVKSFPSGDGESGLSRSDSAALRPDAAKPAEDPMSRIIIHDFKNKLNVIGFGDLVIEYGGHVTAEGAGDDLRLMKEYVHAVRMLENTAIDYLAGKISIENAIPVFTDGSANLASLTRAIRDRLSRGGYNWNPEAREFTELIVDRNDSLILPSLQDIVGWINRGMILTDTELVVNEVLSSVIDRQLIADKSQVEIKISDDLKKTQGLFTYRFILSLAIEELLFNAVKYSNTKKFIISAYITDGGELKVEVIDHGAGISRKNIDKIFDPKAGGFTTAKDKKSGTGYGLLSLRKGIEYLGGKLSLDSEEGRGTVASITLPAKTPFEVEAEAIDVVQTDMPGTDRDKPKGAPIGADETAASQAQAIVDAIHNLFAAGVQVNIKDDTRVLLSENLFMKDSDDSELTQVRIALAPLLKSGYIAIMKPDDLRRAAMNQNVSKDKLAIVMTEEDFRNKEIWNGSDKEASLRSSVLIVNDRLTGDNYLYLEGVIGLAQAVMANNRQAIKSYYQLISGIDIDDTILSLLSDDRENNIAFAVKAILKFRMITRIDPKDLNDLRIRMENLLIAA